MAANTTEDGVPLRYFESPNSLYNMDDNTRRGLLAIGCFATLSLLLTSALLTFISWRMIAWRSHYTSYIGRNQSIVLIYQLILADLLQSLGFLLSFHWTAEGDIIGPSGACFAQGMLIQIGDVASAFFVLAIAIHTTYQVIFSRSLPYNYFLMCTIGTWGLATILTCLAPITGGRYVFLRAGEWCWISADHEDLRLILHYLWIFIVQFGSILIYSAGFWYLFSAKKPGAIRIQGASIEALNKAARAMLAYAIAYTILTLPLAAGRMASMSGNTPSDAYYLFAGAFFTSSGWVDTVLYAFTRRTILFSELDLLGHHHHDDDDDRRRHPSAFARQGSTDDMLAEGGFVPFGGIKTETTVKVELDDLASQEGGSSLEGEHGGKFHYSAHAHAS
ncbi:G protein-coupled glucose receptor regulating Gpa2-domain-containing protein [Xylariomycetidae sp. FL0641]|nr:G protein-coupled glucose receptor regulating Gpa2-domain-containing protein [Xylariomycetidae sp. FL0641]KAI0016262.1 G protein-coupled glucose receptor regulating Gpa2-domain-containing protein [Xylariomycetidae sp. FL0641]